MGGRKKGNMNLGLYGQPCEKECILLPGTTWAWGMTKQGLRRKTVGTRCSDKEEPK